MAPDMPPPGVPADLQSAVKKCPNLLWLCGLQSAAIRKATVYFEAFRLREDTKEHDNTETFFPSHTIYFETFSRFSCQSRIKNVPLLSK